MCPLTLCDLLPIGSLSEPSYTRQGGQGRKHTNTYCSSAELYAHSVSVDTVHAQWGGNRFSCFWSSWQVKCLASGYWEITLLLMEERAILLIHAKANKKKAPSFLASVGISATLCSIGSAVVSQQGSLADITVTLDYSVALSKAKCYIQHDCYCC